MRLFLDTNVFLEYLCGRPNASEVLLLLDIIEDGGHKAFLSSSCFCTIAYYVELTLKERGIYRPEKTEKTRQILNMILGVATISDIDHDTAKTATNDLAFSDFEDSVQYQCALKAECDILVTYNTKDFKNAGSTKMQIMTPAKAYDILQHLS